MTEKQLKSLSQFHKRLLKQLQALPERTADSAVFAIIGIAPLEALLDIRIAVFAHSLANNSRLTRDVMTRQLATKDHSSHSWFIYAQKRLHLYNLPLLIKLITDESTAAQWKCLVKKTILSHWSDVIIYEAGQKSTLKNLKCFKTTAHAFRDTHPLWHHVEANNRDVRRATIKARVLTGTYILQVNRDRYNNSKSPSLCPLCAREPEDRLHFLLRCPSLESRRRPYLDNIQDLIPAVVHWTECDLFQALLDVTYLPACTIHTSVLPEFEHISRKLIYALHTRRHSLLDLP